MLSTRKQNGEEGSLKRTNVLKEGKVSFNGYTLKVYAIEVQKLETVKKFYLAAENENMSGTHIIFGYRLFCSKFPRFQDYSNYGEHTGYQ